MVTIFAIYLEKVGFNKVWITFKFCMVLIANNLSVNIFCFAVDK